MIVPSIAAALGSCVEPSLPKNDVVEAFEYLEQARAELAMSVKPESTEPDCSTLDDDSETDPKFAACYDSVDLPISTIPSLFAEHQADRASAGVLGKVGVILGKAVERQAVQPDPSEASVELSPEQRVRAAWKHFAQSMPKQEAACTAYTPDNCRTAPALPSLWIPEVSSPAAANDSFALFLGDITELDSNDTPLSRDRRLTSRTLDVPVPPPR